MLSTKRIISNYKDIDTKWAFEKYCNLDTKLEGQDIKIHSLFNSNDKTPSMSIYYKNGIYKFKDFSTGIGGNIIKLVEKLYNLDFKEAFDLIKKDYMESDYNTIPTKKYYKYRVTSHKKRSWNTVDQKFWTKFNICSKDLEEYNVYPLESYTMCKEDFTDSINISRDSVYGYFTKDGDLYKIYQPLNKDKKFIKVKDYIQGTDQLKKFDYLLVLSSLKDILSTKSLGLCVDCVAPSSENSYIPKESIDIWKKQYKKVIVMFDNDKAGIEAMKRYREKYELPCILLNKEKDISDSICKLGPTKIKYELVPLINNCINKY